MANFTYTPLSSEQEAQTANALYDYYKGGGIFNLQDANGNKTAYALDREAMEKDPAKAYQDLQSKGMMRQGMGNSNYLAKAATSNSSGSQKPSTPGKDFIRTPDIPKSVDTSTLDKATEYDGYLDRFKKGLMTVEQFYAKTGMYPEDWDKQRGAYEAAVQNQRYNNWTGSDEAVNLLVPRARAAGINVNGLRPDYNYSALDAAIAAQEAGRAYEEYLKK